MTVPYLNAPRETCPNAGSDSEIVPASVTIDAEECAVVLGTCSVSPEAVFRMVAPDCRIALVSMRCATSCP